jgi:hypothetical protein
MKMQQLIMLNQQPGKVVIIELKNILFGLNSGFPGIGY